MGEWGEEFQESQENRTQQFDEAQETRKTAFEAAENQRKAQYDSNMGIWASAVQESVSTAHSAANDAMDAADNANDTADDIRRRVEAGEFNGAPFKVDYTPKSIAEMDRIQNPKVGEFACIQSNVDDEDNSKLFMWGNGQWNFITDMSGAIGIKGDKGAKGDSVSNPEIVGSMLQMRVTTNGQSVTQTLGKVVPERGVDYWTQSDVDDMTDYIHETVEERVGKEYQVMDKSDYDALTEYELDKLYMVRW